MAGIVRVGLDAASGAILGGGQTTVFFDGALAAVLGDRVASHGDSPHSNATMIEASSTVFINGKGVCRAGDRASCGHSVTGSSDAFAN